MKGLVALPLAAVVNLLLLALILWLIRPPPQGDLTLPRWDTRVRFVTPPAEEPPAAATPQPPAPQPTPEPPPLPEPPPIALPPIPTPAPALALPQVPLDLRPRALDLSALEPAPPAPTPTPAAPTPTPAAPALAPPAPVVAPGPVIARPTWRIDPLYPQRARRLGIEGRVVVEFTVDETGRAITPEIVESEPPGLFDASVLGALRQWRFEIEQGDGGPRRYRARQEILFRLRQR